jgi:hypothetical protein
MLKGKKARRDKIGAKARVNKGRSTSSELGLALLRKQLSGDPGQRGSRHVLLVPVSTKTPNSDRVQGKARLHYLPDNANCTPTAKKKVKLAPPPHDALPLMS